MTKRKLIGSPPPATKDRPRCPYCDRPRSPHFNVIDYGKHTDPNSTRIVEWNGTYRGYGAFCSLRCAEFFANAAYRAGYRIKTQAKGPQ